MSDPWHVVLLNTNNEHLYTISGLGKSRGTGDHSHSKSVAYRHAAKLRKESNENYHAAPMFGRAAVEARCRTQTQ